MTVQSVKENASEFYCMIDFLRNFVTLINKYPKAWNYNKAHTCNSIFHDQV